MTNETNETVSAAQRSAVAALLDWYAQAGIDTILLDAPRDRFSETAVQAVERRQREPAAPPAIVAAGTARASEAPRAPATAEPRSRSVAVPDDVAIADARERARSAATLDELNRAFASFEGCNLRLTARSLVFGDGNPKADIMLVGEAPGREEDIAGVPFVGRSGQLLNRMLAAIGVAREDVRVTNTVPWRPPGNRTPTPAETEICLPFVARQIELVRPKILLCIGSPATKAILRNEEGILRLRGQWLSYSFGLEPDETIAAMPMLHPAYLLRQPAQKRLAWRDWLAVRLRLEGLRRS